MGPEITRLYGKGDWPGLSLLYNYSERFIFFCIPIVNLGVFSVSPLLLTLWLHKGGLFSLPLYAVMTGIAFVMCAKEHKFNFQFSTNTHESLARVMFFSYLAMAALSVLFIHLFSVTGLLAAWLLTEVFQLIYIMRLNFDLFSHHEKVEIAYVIKLAIFAIVGIAVAMFVLQKTYAMSLVVRIAAAITEGLVVAAISYLAFDMAVVMKKFMPKVTQRFGFAK
jgi:O-antigen/teichoic acid export membrane protein